MRGLRCVQRAQLSNQLEVAQTIVVLVLLTVTAGNAIDVLQAIADGAATSSGELVLGSVAAVVAALVGLLFATLLVRFTLTISELQHARWRAENAGVNIVERRLQSAEGDARRLADSRHQDGHVDSREEEGHHVDSHEDSHVDRHVDRHVDSHAGSRAEGHVEGRAEDEVAAVVLHEAWLRQRAVFLVGRFREV